MDNTLADKYSSMVVAPYIQKATALIGVPRKVGGNQFRHMLATFAILIDYLYTDPVLLKASLIHDLLEDFPDADHEEIRHIDSDGKAVLSLVAEVSRTADETKEEFLRRLLNKGSGLAKTLKVADRISNLTDLHPNVCSGNKMRSYLEQTKKYIYPMALMVNKDMAVEVLDLIERRKRYLNHY